MHPVIPYVIAALLFGIGVYGVLVRRNAVLMLAAVELMLNAVNLILVTADTTVPPGLPHAGSVFALFVIVLAAAEIGIGLAIVLQLYRLRGSISVDGVALGERLGIEPPVETVRPLDAPGATVPAGATTGAGRARHAAGGHDGPAAAGPAPTGVAP
ncbi:MAG TPA: NADH-quinone oxidoreductase subunit NuoK [Micromonosporaceae bacterium]|nr:NADH-quinone oxidoreductase subunit NuoK [Micromonosporaceae bacterium]